MKHIGLMLVKDDEDILDEIMSRNASFFDTIFVLDGTKDNTKTKAIITRYPNVEVYMRDDELPEKYQKRCDGMRGALLEEIKKRHGDEGWITLLHSDEMFFDYDPRVVAEVADANGAAVVNWPCTQFFLHTSQRYSYTYDPTKSVIDQVLWGSFPGWIEHRQFKNAPGLAYNPTLHGLTIPANAAKKAWPTYNCIRHYSYRHPIEMIKTAHERLERKWQMYGEWMDRLGTFVDILPKYYTTSMQVGMRKVIQNANASILVPCGSDPIESFTRPNNWFEIKYARMVKPIRYPTFKIALDAFLKTGIDNIVETGTNRTNNPDEGVSTTLFGNFCKIYGKRLWTVDISSVNMANSRNFTAEFAGNISYNVSDSVEFLNRFPNPIGLLYLDSMDCDPMGDSSQAQMHSLKELEAAWRCLVPGSIIMIDDCGWANGGKGLLSKQFLRDHDAICLADSFQTVWAKR